MVTSSSSKASKGASKAEAAKEKKEVDTEVFHDCEDEPSVPAGLRLARKDWAAALGELREVRGDLSIPASERVRRLNEALTQLVDDTRSLDEDRAICERRLQDTTKERDRIRDEQARSEAAKAKLEASCKEMQQQKGEISKENTKIAEEEQKKFTELREKFEQAMKDVQEKMDAEQEVRQHFIKENDELRGKYQKFTESYEAKEAQLGEQRLQREQEMEAAQSRLQEHEALCKESKIKAARLEKHNIELRATEAQLKQELNTILAKFDEFHEAITKSNTNHGECKVEIESLTAKVTDMEKENADLLNSDEMKQLTKEHETAQKQEAALQKLCDNLKTERLAMKEEIKRLNKKK